MTSTRSALVVAAVALGLSACGLAPPAEPPPFDCAQIDRAEERFPDECADAGPDLDAGDGDDGGVGDVDASDVDAADVDASDVDAADGG